ncbi:MAG TPA: HdeD family acid-resistance protein [Steroidobacteraceae bacterium]|nr:HdeD family acid-resistance protein [Steroidobacteraceae bacterium]
MPAAMLGLLRRNWWTLVLRGACAIAFGMFAWFWPQMTVLVLLLAWGTLACLGGIATLIGAFAREGGEARWIMMLEGGLSLAMGAYALAYPRSAALLFLWLLAAWALFSGIFQMVAAWRLRAEIRGEFWLGCAGVLSFLFGVLLLLRPGAGALALVWMIASFSVLYGIVLIAWGLHLRRLRADGAQAEVQLRIRQ